MGRFNHWVIVCDFNARDLLRPDYGSGIRIFPIFKKFWIFKKLTKLKIRRMQASLFHFRGYKSEFPFWRIIQVFQLSRHVTTGIMSSFACHQFVSPSQKLELVRHYSQKLEKFLEWKFYQKSLKKSLEKEFKLEEMKLTLRLTWKRWKFSAYAKCDNSRVIRPFETFSKLRKVKINYCLTRGVKLSNKLN